jgi:hypothetical protein
MGRPAFFGLGLGIADWRAKRRVPEPAGSVPSRPASVRPLRRRHGGRTARSPGPSAGDAHVFPITFWATDVGRGVRNRGSAEAEPVGAVKEPNSNEPERQAQSKKRFLLSGTRRARCLRAPGFEEGVCQGRVRRRPAARSAPAADGGIPAGGDQDRLQGREGGSRARKPSGGRSRPGGPVLGPHGRAGHRFRMWWSRPSASPIGRPTAHCMPLAPQSFHAFFIDPSCLASRADHRQSFTYQGGCLRAATFYPRPGRRASNRGPVWQGTAGPRPSGPPRLRRYRGACRNLPAVSPRQVGPWREQGSLGHRRQDRLRAGVWCVAGSRSYNGVGPRLLLVGKNPTPSVVQGPIAPAPGRRKNALVLRRSAHYCFWTGPPVPAAGHLISFRPRRLGFLGTAPGGGDLSCQPLRRLGSTQPGQDGGFNARTPRGRQSPGP